MNIKEKLDACEKMLRVRGRHSKLDDEATLDTYLKHGTVAKAAQALGLTAGGFNNRLHMARKRLAKKVAE